LEREGEKGKDVDHWSLGLTKLGSGSKLERFKRDRVILRGLPDPPSAMVNVTDNIEEDSEVSLPVCETLGTVELADGRVTILTFMVEDVLGPLVNAIDKDINEVKETRVMVN
jgi:hypothetical protein